jgi:hypothetical protein
MSSPPGAAETAYRNSRPETQPSVVHWDRHLRAGFEFAGFGYAGTTRGDQGERGFGPGLGGSVGLPATRLIAIVLSVRTYSILWFSSVEADLIVDFTIGDRVILGGGIGVLGLFAPSSIDPAPASSASLMFPTRLTFVAVPYLHRNEARRHGFTVIMNVAPGVAPYALSSWYACGQPAYPRPCQTEVALSASLGVGWEWY